VILRNTWSVCSVAVVAVAAAADDDDGVHTKCDATMGSQ